LGAGFVLALSKRWKTPEVEYKKWSRGHISVPRFELGQVQFVKVEEDIVVGNMVGQEGVRTRNRVAPIRYSALDDCLSKVSMAAIKNKASVHGPRLRRWFSR